MNKIIRLFVLLIMFSSLVIANDNNISDTLCIKDNELQKTQFIMQDNGFQIIMYNNNKYYYFVNSCLMPSNNKCLSTEIPLFLKK